MRWAGLPWRSTERSSSDTRAFSGAGQRAHDRTLTANLQGAGIEYLHLRGLGTPAEGRAAARTGRHGEMREIFREHLATPGTRAELDALAEIVRAGRRVCLLCLEADPTHCHRSLVANALASMMPMRVTHLVPPEL